MNECGLAAHGLSRAEVLTRRSAIPSGSSDDLQVTGGGYPATRLNVDDAVTRLTSEKVSGRMNERGRATHGLSRAEVLTRRSAIPSGSSDDLQVRSPHYPRAK